MFSPNCFGFSRQSAVNAVECEHDAWQRDGAVGHGQHLRWLESAAYFFAVFHVVFRKAKVCEDVKARAEKSEHECLEGTSPGTVFS